MTTPHTFSDDAAERLLSSIFQDEAHEVGGYIFSGHATATATATPPEHNSSVDDVLSNDTSRIVDNAGPLLMDVATAYVIMLETLGLVAARLKQIQSDVGAVDDEELDTLIEGMEEASRDAESLFPLSRTFLETDALQLSVLLRKASSGML